MVQRRGVALQPLLRWSATLEEVSHSIALPSGSCSGESCKAAAIQESGVDTLREEVVQKGKLACFGCLEQDGAPGCRVPVVGCDAFALDEVLRQAEVAEDNGRLQRGAPSGFEVHCEEYMALPQTHHERDIAKPVCCAWCGTQIQQPYDGCALPTFGRVVERCAPIIVTEVQRRDIGQIADLSGG
mmetsp:Transcript_49543/g.127887  ORF Transcript_49543/g.127887 Transcript_49543/m.127887 type:complete len:185 (+) Transcript_49543:534-1088(+)